VRAKRYEGTSDEQTGTWLEAYTVCRWRALFPHLCPGTSRESSSTRATASTRETCWSRLCTKWFAYYILVRYVYFYCRNEFNEFPYHAGWGNCWGRRSCEEPLKGLGPDVDCRKDHPRLPAAPPTSCTVTFSAMSTHRVSAPISGVVRNVRARPGDAVKRGDVLCVQSMAKVRGLRSAARSRGAAYKLDRSTDSRLLLLA